MARATGPVPFYLRPYQNARDHGVKGFQALLWSSREGQAVRFEVIARALDLTGRTLLDVGCGRADLLVHLLERGTAPAHYTGLEMMPAAIRSARRRRLADCRIVAGDFVREPETMAVGAEVVVFSGSLNTLSRPQFYRTLTAAWAVARRALAFNFLCSRFWCGEDWLTWHRKQTVLAFCRSLGGEPRAVDGYLRGDCTILMERPETLESPETVERS
jgi:SAM-dependent methyltransferase